MSGISIMDRPRSPVRGEEGAPEIEFNHRRSLGYFIMFSINFYICLVVCIHGSTMSNEDIESQGFSGPVALQSEKTCSGAPTSKWTQKSISTLGHEIREKLGAGSILGNSYGDCNV